MWAFEEAMDECLILQQLKVEKGTQVKILKRLNASPFKRLLMSNGGPEFNHQSSRKITLKKELWKAFEIQIASKKIAWML